MSDPAAPWESVIAQMPENVRAQIRANIRHESAQFAPAGYQGLPQTMTAPLTALRAEVARLRDQMLTVVDAYRGAGTRDAINNRMAARSEVAAYNRVLDLIDKHTREGQ